MRTVLNWLRTSGLAAAVVVGAMATNAMAAVVTYTLTGGAITGTLNGTAFSNANYTITAQADPSTFSSGNTGPGGILPIQSAIATSTMTIDGFAPFQITRTNFSIVVLDYSVLVSGFYYGGFATPEGVEGFGAGGYPSGNPIAGPGVISGITGVSAATYQTNAGDLIITSFTDSGSTFTASGSSAVPEPTSMAIFGLGALGFAYRNQRKLVK